MSDLAEQSSAVQSLTQECYAAELQALDAKWFKAPAVMTKDITADRLTDKRGSADN